MSVGLFDDLIASARAEGGDGGAKPQSTPTHQPASANGMFADLIPARASDMFADLKPETPPRNAFAYANDFAIDTANAAAGLAKAGVDLVAPGSAPSKAIGGFIKSGEQKQSDWKQAKRAELGQKLADADGEMDKAGTYLQHAVVEDPLGTAAEVAGNLGPFRVLGAALGGVGAATRTGATMGVAGGLSAGEVRGNIFEKIEGVPDAELQASSPDYATLRQTMTESEAKAQIAGSFSRNAPEVLAAGAFGALGGRFGFEGMAARAAPSRGRIANAAIGVLDESSQGAAEQLASNVGIRRTLPDQSLIEDVALNAVAEGVIGLGGAAIGPSQSVQHDVQAHRGPEGAANPTATWRNKDFDLPVEVIGQPESDQDGKLFVPVRGTIDGVTSTNYVPADELDGWSPDAGPRATPAAPKPSEQMGIDPAAGPMSKAAARSVDSRSTPVERERDFVPPPSGSFAEMNELASLLGDERADVVGARDRIAQAQDMRREFEFEEADRRTAEQMQHEGQARRRAVLDTILEDPETADPEQRFRAELKRSGFRDAAPTEDEITTIQRFVAVRDAAPAATEIEPSAPNELDAEAVGIRERKPAPVFSQEGGAGIRPPEPVSKPLAPFTQAGAEKTAARWMQEKGEQYAVVPHPIAKDRFAVIPARQAQASTAEAAAVADADLQAQSREAGAAGIGGSTQTGDGAAATAKPVFPFATQEIAQARAVEVSSGGRQFVAAPHPSVPGKFAVLPADTAQIGVERAPASGQVAPDLAGEKLNRAWTSFANDSGTLGVPRAQMPQIKAEHRGAMTNFMNARGVEHRQEVVPADSLKPTQAEFSPSKVKKAQGFVGGDRSILVSADGYVLDGHHQWLAKREAGESIKVIRLEAPIQELVQLAHEFPSSTTARGAAKSHGVPLTEAGARKRAADLAQRTGTPHEVVAHPVARGRFMAAPVGADQPTEPAPEQRFQFSRQPDNQAAGVTSDSFRQSFHARMPSLSGALDAMLERGRNGERGGVVLIESADQAVIAATVQQHTGRAAQQLSSVGAEGHDAGLYDPQSGLTFLIGPNLSERTAPGVLLHEVVHGQQREKLDAAAQQLIAGRDGAAPAVRLFLDRVQERIDAAGAQDDPRESMPYIVEQAVTEGRQQGFSAADSKFMDWVDQRLGKPVGNLVRALVMRVRSWAYRNGLPLKTLYVDDLVAVAHSGMREAARGRVNLGSGAIQHSRAATAGTPEGGNAATTPPRVTLKDWIAHHLQNHRGWALGALTRDQIADIYGRDMPAVRRFDEVVQAMDQERNARTEAADKLVERWRALPKAQADRLADVMHAATLAQFDPDTFNATTTDEEALKTAFNALNPDARKVYREVRDQYRDTLVQLRDSLGTRVERAGSHGARAAAEIRLKFDQYLKNGPYFSLARFGDLVLIADKGDERIVQTFEGSLPREKRQRELRARGFTVKLTARAEYSASKDGPAGQFVGDVLQRIDALDIDAADKARLMDGLNQLAINLLPDASYRKHFAHRKGTPGFSNDAMRAFAASQMHAAHHIARIKHADELSLLIDEMQKSIQEARGDVDVTERQQVVNELKRRLDYLMNPTTHPAAAAAGQVGFVMSLGGSVASGLVNLTQTPMVTLPYLGATHGFPKATAALMKASRDYFGGRWEKWSGFVVMKNPKLSLDEKGALRQLEAAGLINLTQMHDLAGAANADTTVSRRAWAMNRAMKIVGWTFHVPEVFNRQVSALAAFRLAKEAGQDNESAVEYARQTLIRTHFDYSASNRARFMQGNFTRVITMFKQYSQQMTYLLWRNAYQALKGESPEVRREARRMLMGVAATHFTAAGSLGLPLGVFGVSPLLSLLALGMGDDDDPYDWEVEYRQMLADTFGKAGGEMIAKGPLRAVLNVDMASRVGLGDLWVRAPLKEAEGRDLVEAWMLTLLGPIAGYAGQMGAAAKAFDEGKYGRGLESMLPKFIAAPLKALRYQSEGVRSWKGDALGIDLTPPDVIGVALGFQPTRLAEMYEGRSAVKGRESRLQARRQEILNMWVASYMAGDRSGTAEAMQAARAFNQRNPEFWIKPDAFRKSYQAKMRNASQIRDGIHLSRRRETLRDEGRFANVQ